MNVNKNKIVFHNEFNTARYQKLPSSTSTSNSNSKNLLKNFLKTGPVLIANRNENGSFRLGNADKTAPKRLKKQPVHTPRVDVSSNAASSANVNNVNTTQNRVSSARKNESSYNDSALQDDTAVILAITEGRGYARGEVGIAAIDTNRPKLILSQFSDDIYYTGTLTKLNIHNPIEIIVPNTFTLTNTKSKLLTFTEQMYPNVAIKTIPRRHFNDSEALEAINKLCSPKSENIKVMFQQKFYALASAGALLKYLEFKNILFTNKTLKIEYETKYGNMVLDVETSHRLELLYPLCNTREKRASLYGILNNCVTILGKRSLRAKILQPTCDIPSIQRTNQCIKELMLQDDALSSIMIILKNFYNIDRLLRLSVIVPQEDNIRASEIMINLALLLKTCLESIDPLKAALENLESTTFVEMKELLQDPRYSYLIDQINTVLSSDAQHCTGTALYFQRLFAVKSNVNELLDVTRTFYTENMDKMNTLVKDFSDQFELPMKLTYSKPRGFHIQLSLPKDKEVPELPEDVDVLYRRGFNIFITTSELMKMNFEINDVIDEIQIMSNVIIGNLFMKFQSEIDAIYLLTGIISELDIIQSFTIVSKTENFCCPSFGEELRVVAGFHPFMEYSQQRINSVPNNIIATPEFNFFVITGPNMGGKTIYIKTIAILQIIAQLGCFVPAKEATFRICDKLFTRIGFDDKMEQCASSFTIEMRDMEYILKNITPNSLIIIDELCRSTNPKEGKIISWKICEKLIKMRGVSNDGKYFNETHSTQDDMQNIEQRANVGNITAPYIFLATHFKEMTKLAEQFNNVFNLHMKAEEYLVDGKVLLKFTHTVEEGVNPITGYGLALARSIRFPYDVIPRADEIMKTVPPISTQDMSAMSLSTSLLSVSRNTSTNTAAIDRIQVSEVEKTLYDLFSNIMAIQRAITSNPDIQYNNLLQNFMQNQSNDFISALKSTDLNETISNYTFQEAGNIPETQSTNPNDLSFHSLRRRFQENGNTNNMLETSSQVIDDSLFAIVHPVSQSQRSVNKTYTIIPQSQNEDSREMTYITNKQTAQEQHSRANSVQILASQSSAQMEPLNSKPHSTPNLQLSYQTNQKYIESQLQRPIANLAQPSPYLSNTSFLHYTPQQPPENVGQKSVHLDVNNVERSKKPRDSTSFEEFYDQTRNVSYLRNNIDDDDDILSIDSCDSYLSNRNRPVLQNQPSTSKQQYLLTTRDNFNHEKPQFINQDKDISYLRPPLSISSNSSVGDIDYFIGSFQPPAMLPQNNTRNHNRTLNLFSQSNDHQFDRNSSFQFSQERLPTIKTEIVDFPRTQNEPSPYLPQIYHNRQGHSSSSQNRNDSRFVNSVFEPNSPEKSYLVNTNDPSDTSFENTSLLQCNNTSSLRNAHDLFESDEELDHSLRMSSSSFDDSFDAVPTPSSLSIGQNDPYGQHSNLFSNPPIRSRYEIPPKTHSVPSTSKFQYNFSSQNSRLNLNPLANNSNSPFFNISSINASLSPPRGASSQLMTSSELAGLNPEVQLRRAEEMHKRENVRQQTQEFMDKIMKEKVLKQTNFKRSKMTDNCISEHKNKRLKKD